MTACTINGKQCTQCCRAITLSYTRRYLGKAWGYDAKFILANWKQISRRRAKKKNPYMVRELGKRRHTFWHCARVTDAGCSVYDDRPNVCSGYPLYGQAYDRVAKLYAERGFKPEYHPDCTEWPRIAAVEVK